MATVHELRRERQRNSGITGFFWMLPRAAQAQRARDLARTFTLPQVASIVHLSVREVTALIEAAR
jgi:hypothetical protein